MFGNFDILTPSLFAVFTIANIRAFRNKTRSDNGKTNKLWNFFEVYQNNKVSGIRILLIMSLCIKLVVVIFGLGKSSIVSIFYGLSAVVISIFVSYFYLLYLTLYKNIKSFVGVISYWIIAITIFVLIWLGVVPILGLRGSNTSWKLLIVFVTVITPLVQFIRSILYKGVPDQKNSLVFFREAAIFLLFVLGMYLINVSIGFSVYFVQNPREQFTKINQTNDNPLTANWPDFTAFQEFVILTTKFSAGGKQFLSNSDPSIPVNQLEDKKVKEIPAKQVNVLYPILAEATLIQFCYTVIGFALVMDWISRKRKAPIESNTEIILNLNRLTKEVREIEATLNTRKSKLIEKRKARTHRKK
ncbi:hypothetical protein Lpp14_13884 [Lacticaseibacillus paracasei subsp. paracasei Lpp14]|jgi:hypothetical protein|uniref:Uncharacterized protein n=1 Tax=Lacticaseibacillus paracasei subsp. paracasei Lpp14 TaxID=1256204 RepID=A0A829GLX7_LACPA|nr:hypothetical protein Lpp14_13884 [Lacticaseibacillus paracasei subsp. paracasei Lpp14]